MEIPLLNELQKQKAYSTPRYVHHHGATFANFKPAQRLIAVKEGVRVDRSGEVLKQVAQYISALQSMSAGDVTTSDVLCRCRDHNTG